MQVRSEIFAAILPKTDTFPCAPAAISWCIAAATSSATTASHRTSRPRQPPGPARESTAAHSVFRLSRQFFGADCVITSAFRSLMTAATTAWHQLSPPFTVALLLRSCCRAPISPPELFIVRGGVTNCPGIEFRNLILVVSIFSRLTADRGSFQGSADQLEEFGTKLSRLCDEVAGLPAGHRVSVQQLCPCLCRRRFDRVPIACSSAGCWRSQLIFPRLFVDLPLPFHCLSLTFHCLVTDFP